MSQAKRLQIAHSHSRGIFNTLARATSHEHVMFSLQCLIHLNKTSILLSVITLNLHVVALIKPAAGLLPVILFNKSCITFLCPLMELQLLCLFHLSN